MHYKITWSGVIPPCKASSFYIAITVIIHEYPRAKFMTTDGHKCNEMTSPTRLNYPVIATVDGFEVARFEPKNKLEGK